MSGSETGSLNTDAILEWAAKNRPDLLDTFRRIIEGSNPAYVLMMTSAFEAGRMFQTKVSFPATYQPLDVDYFVGAGRAAI